MSAKKKKKVVRNFIPTKINAYVRSYYPETTSKSFPDLSSVVGSSIEKRQKKAAYLFTYHAKKKERKKKEEERRRKNCKLVLSTVERRRKEKGAKRIISVAPRGSCPSLVLLQSHPPSPSIPFLHGPVSFSRNILNIEKAARKRIG